MEKPTPQHDPADALWLRVWKTSGIRWLGPKGDGTADAMERWKHGFEHGFREGMNRAQLVTLRTELGAREIELANLKIRVKKLKRELA
jgi:hypothetical protein